MWDEGASRGRRGHRLPVALLGVLATAVMLTGPLASIALAGAARDYRILESELPRGWKIGADRGAGSAVSAVGGAGLRSSFAQVIVSPGSPLEFVGVAIGCYADDDGPLDAQELQRERHPEMGLEGAWVTIGGYEVWGSHAPGLGTAYVVTGGNVLASVTSQSDDNARTILLLLLQKLPPQVSRGLPDWVPIVGGVLAAGLGLALLRSLLRPRGRTAPPAQASQVPQFDLDDPTDPPERSPTHVFEDPAAPPEPAETPERDPDVPTFEMEGLEAETESSRGPEREEDEDRDDERRPVVLNLTARPTRIVADGAAKVRLVAQVLEVEGAPVAGVQVRFDARRCGERWRLDPTEASSDEDGLARAEWTWLDTSPPDGRARIEAIATSYRGEPLHLEATALVEVVRDAAGVEVAVHTPTGDPLDGVEVELDCVETRRKHACTTGSDGLAAFDAVDRGRYVAYASKEGHESADGASERASTKVTAEAGARARLRLELRPRRRLVESYLRHEQALHEATLFLAVGDRDGYLHNLAWAFGNVGAFLLEESLQPGVMGKLERGVTFVVNEVVDQGGAGVEAAQAVAPASAFASDVQAALDLLIEDLWPRVAAVADIPPNSGFRTEAVKAGTGALLRMSSLPEMQQAIRKGYMEALSDADLQTVAAKGGVRDLGVGMARPLVVRAVLYHAALLALPRGYLGADLDALNAIHRDERAHWEERTDADLLQAFEDEPRFREFEAILECWTAFLRDDAKRLREYTAGESGLERIAGMLADGVQDLLGGEDAYRKQRVGLPGGGHRFTYVNHLPLAVRGLEYFLSAGDYWALLTVLSMGGAGGAGAVFDLGFKGGACACLVLGVPSIQRDLESLRSVLQSVSDAARDRGFAAQFLEQNAAP